MILPGMRRRVAVPAAAAGCQLTSGQWAPAEFRGFYSGLIGSISEQPVAGQTLDYLIYYYTGANYPRTQMKFIGDIRGILSGLTVWVDGVDYGTGDLGGGGWYLSDGNTITIWSTGGPVLDNATVYLLEVK